MSAVRMVQPAMTATTHQNDFECLMRRTLKVANTTNGRNVKPIAVSIGMVGMGGAYHSPDDFIVTLAYPLTHAIS